jgi:UDP-N-acetylmuramate--alanine ligase
MNSPACAGGPPQRTAGDPEDRPWSERRLHFVGVGGAGMSGYARAAYALGARVSGSDRADSPYLERLRADGVLTASLGHAAANVPAGEEVEVIYSSAVAAENPEREAARARGLRERPRADLLEELTALRRTIAVAGTHGKTTTSAMLVHALRAADMDPGWLVGGEVGGGLPNAHWSEGEWLVVEADESDRSMLSLRVEIAVVTNMELDHHAMYSSLAELREAFRAFLARAGSGIVVWDRPELRALIRPPLTAVTKADELLSAERLSLTATMEPRGIDVVAYDAPDPTLETGDRSKIVQRFRWHQYEVRLAVPGAHNALNASAALEAALLAGADPERAIAGLASFGGAERRFQLLGEGPAGAVLYEDYAHHPTEIEATLKAARTLPHERLVAVFQPHLYSRTGQLAREFGQALALADVVAVTDVYPARERAEDYPGVGGLRVAEAAADAGHGRPVYWLPSFAEAEPVLRTVLRAGDLCLLMGAGDINALGQRLVSA